MSAARPQRRIAVVFGALVVGLTAIAGKLAYVQLVKGETLQALAARRQTGTADARPVRGEIVDAHGEVLAISLPAVSLYAHPHRLDAAARAAVCQALREAALGDACARLDQPAKFVWLGRELARRDHGPLLAALKGIEGVGWIDGEVRTYPNGSLAGQTLGFVGVDGKALEGIERAWDELLRPQPQHAAVARDARRKLLLDPEDVAQLQVVQRNVELALDISVQALVEAALLRGLEQAQGSAAIALVAEAQSGAIRAAAVAPGFDPNHFRAYEPADWRARYATDAFEPGSTVKPLMLAAALDAGHSLHEIVYAEDGEWLVDEHLIGDVDPHGWLSLRNVVVRSSNIGIAKVGQLLGKERMEAAYRSFGFGRRVGVQMPSESQGIFRPHQRWSALDWATLSFGQGLSVTPLQLLRAYLRVANEGRPVDPYLVERVFRADDGQAVWTRPEPAGEPFGDAALMTTIRDVLESVVVEGTGQRAAIEGLRIGGKTGTAQKPDLVQGGYREGAYIAWFVGMFPIEDPQWVAVVLVDEPQASIYGGAVAAPVFREVAEAVAIREGLLSRDAARVAHARLPESPVQRTTVAAIDIVPDLSGMSLREAGALAQASGAHLVPRGSGRVVAQQPAAGAGYARGDAWTVELVPGQGTQG